MSRHIDALSISPAGDFELEAPPLYTAEDGAVIRVQGTRVSLDTVIGAFREGCSPEEIVERYPTLRLAAVYAVIAYFLQHQEGVEAYLAQRQRAAARLRERIEKRFPPDGVRERILNRRTA